MRKSWLFLIVLVVGLVAPPAASANDIARFKTVFGSDVKYAGFGGMRGNGTGTINLSGVSGPVSEAYLYWHGPTNSDQASANANANFNGQGITGTQIGFSNNNCWGFTNSQAYRADVSSIVRAKGNGSYALANFRKANAEVNGVSLVVFYRDANTANNRDVVIFNNNDSNITNTFDADGWNVNLPGINYSSGNASIDLHVSDGQTPGESAVKVNDQTIFPDGAIFSGNTVPHSGGAAGSVSDLLWDIRSANVTSLLKPGSNTLRLTSATGNDCLSLIVAAVNLPAGAAPGQPPVQTGPAGNPDPPPCDGRPATIVNVAGDANVAGTPGDDVIVTGNGNDIVDGAGGNDRICTGAGNDRAEGGAGNDRVFVGLGNDRAFGESGRDFISGSRGDDRVSGGSGNDRIRSDSGNDRSSGGSGNDRVIGDRGNDRVAGDSGKDIVGGTQGNDQVSGGSGSDRIGGNSGNDRLNPGSGKDRVNGGSGNDVITLTDSSRDFVNCSTGRDRVSRDGNDKISLFCERISNRG